MLKVSHLFRRIEWNLLFGCAQLVFLIVISLCANFVYPGDPLEMVARPLISPGSDRAFPLGTDSLGRDLLAQIIHGSRASLMVGFVAAGWSLTIGILVGAAGGYFGGSTDRWLVRLTELFQTVPTFLLVVMIVAIREPSLGSISAAIGIASWPTIARLVRAEFRSLKNAEFVVAAKSIGAGHLRIIGRTILPNALPPIIVSCSFLMANAILTEAGLSFLRMGDPNVISWGAMIGQGRDLIRSASYLTIVPGLAIASTVMSLNMIGDGLNHVLNPRS